MEADMEETEPVEDKILVLTLEAELEYRERGKHYGGDPTRSFKFSAALTKSEGQVVVENFGPVLRQAMADILKAGEPEKGLEPDPASARNKDFFNTIVEPLREIMPEGFTWLDAANKIRRLALAAEGKGAS